MSKTPCDIIDILKKIKHKLTDQEYIEILEALPRPEIPVRRISARKRPKRSESTSVIGPTTAIETLPKPEILVRRVSKDYPRDTTGNWLAKGPKISKVGCPCNNDMSKFGGYQHCSMCGSNGGYYSDS